MQRRSFLAGGLLGLTMPAGLCAGGCSAEDAKRPGAGPDPASASLAKEPALLAGRGYRLTFSDEFETPLDVGEVAHRWCPHMWWERPMNPRQYGVRDSSLYLRIFADDGWRNCNLTTEWADTRGGSFFRGGYFEARIFCARAWNAFWLFSVNHSRALPKTTPDRWCSELDILETDSAQPRRLVGTLHRNTGGSANGGPPDRQNPNNNHDLSSEILGRWHIYSALWTEDKIVWLVDGKEIARCPTFRSSWQYMFLILGLGKGGVNGGPAPTGDIDMVEMRVDWVRVWQPPSAG